MFDPQKLVFVLFLPGKKLIFFFINPFLEDTVQVGLAEPAAFFRALSALMRNGRGAEWFPYLPGLSGVGFLDTVAL